jgi:DNA-binding transcriptional ArsR family regulator
MPDSLQTFKAEFFKALAHPLRIKILECLRQSEKNVTELQNALNAEQSVVSQQLSILRSKNLIGARKTGTTVFYSVRDPLLFELLDVARKIFNNQLIETKDLLNQLDNEKAETVQKE